MKIKLSTKKISAPGVELLLGEILNELKGIRMDTSALKSAFGDFAAKFAIFATDMAAYIARQPAADTPEQIADVKSVSDGLTGLSQQVAAMDASINPVPAPDQPA